MQELPSSQLPPMQFTSVGSVAVSLLVSSSSPPETVTVLVTDKGALLATLTTSEIGGKLWPDGNESAPVRVQETLPMSQLQPAPSI